jgi:hypothetical protein
LLPYFLSTPNLSEFSFEDEAAAHSMRFVDFGDQAYEEDGLVFEGAHVAEVQVGSQLVLVSASHHKPCLSLTMYSSKEFIARG